MSCIYMHHFGLHRCWLQTTHTTYFTFYKASSIASSFPSSVSGWQDPYLKEAAMKEMAELQQHKIWWDKKNNGVSRSWVMQDGCSPDVTRYRETDGAPWVFVYECKDSGIPADAMNAIYLFSPHAINNMKGAVVPTSNLTPKLESASGGGGGGSGTSNDSLSKRWKVSGIWRHIVPSINSNQSGNNNNNNNRMDVDENLLEEDFSMDSIRIGSGGHANNPLNGGGASSSSLSRANNNDGNVCIHDMALDKGLPSLSGGERIDLEKIAPLRVELFFPRVYYYDPRGCELMMGEDRPKVLQKVFCLVAVTPARNFSLTEYARLYLVENAGNSHNQNDNHMMIHRRELLQEILLDQIGMCEHLRQYMYFSSSSSDTNQQQQQQQQKNPLDMFNVPSHDLFPGNYLCVQMAYKKIQTRLFQSYGIDHSKIYVEGFSQSVNLLLQKDPPIQF